LSNRRRKLRIGVRDFYRSTIHLNDQMTTGEKKKKNLPMTDLYARFPLRSFPYLTRPVWSNWARSRRMGSNCLEHRGTASAGA